MTLSGPLSAQSTADLAALWKEISAFGASIQDVPLSELQERLTDFERQILAIVQQDPAWVPPSAGTPTTPAGTSTTAPGRHVVADHGGHRILDCRHTVVDELLVERARLLVESGQPVVDQSGRPVERHGPHGLSDPADADLDGGTSGRGAGHGHALTGGCAAYPPVQ